MSFQTTVQRPVGTKGVGLHSGVPVSIRICPAAAGTGIVFVRKDLDDFQIAASWKNVTRVSYATSLMRQGVLISTTEHLLSVLYSMQVDNVIIEIDNLEVPILDGSGKQFIEILSEAGVKTLPRRREYVRIKEPVSVETPGKRVSIEPAESFRLTCEVFFDHPLIGQQSLDMELTPDRYASEIAPARTFGFTDELDKLRDMGLIRGASEANAVGFSPEGVVNPGGLRFPDEPCRHKALDLIGDLALLGRPLLGHVRAERAGHAMHVALVAKIMAHPSVYEVITLEERVEQALVAGSR